MSRRRVVLSTLAAAAILGVSAPAQSVISARSGVVHFFEGSVFLDSERLEPRLGKYPLIADGAQLRTEQGRAEVLLTPGVFLRIGDNTSIRLIRSELADTQVELVNGSATIDCTQTASGESFTLIFQQWKAHFLTKGLYRIDSQPPVLRARNGTAEVAAGDQAPVTVPGGMSLPLAAVLVPEQSGTEPADALAEWSIGRRQSILADDAVSAEIDEDPASRTDLSAALDGVAYFPVIGVPVSGPGYDGQDALYGRYQFGFNSIYLPGYHYRPLGLAVLGFGLLGRRAYSSIYGSRMYSGGLRPPAGGVRPPGYYVPRAPHISPGSSSRMQAPIGRPVIVPGRPPAPRGVGIGVRAPGRGR